jgi:hypothetical protein
MIPPEARTSAAFFTTRGSGVWGWIDWIICFPHQ